MTNKLKLSAVALFSAIALGGGVFTTAASVFAAEGDPVGDTSAPSTDQTPTTDPDNGEDVTKEAIAADVKEDAATKSKSSTATGHAFVSFNNDSDNGPWDPKDPDTPDPDDPNKVTGDTGYIRLVAIPKVLNFGDNSITGGTQVLELLNGSTNLATNTTTATTDKTGKDDEGNDTPVIYTQVYNIDPATPTWTLSATLNDFEDGAGNTLKGAVLDFASGKDQSITGTAGVGDGLSWTDTGNTVKDMSLTAGDTTGKNTATYLTSTQTGASQQVWQDKNVHLTVPGDQIKAAAYSATIDWNLSASPITPAPAKQ